MLSWMSWKNQFVEKLLGKLEISGIKVAIINPVCLFPLEVYRVLYTGLKKILWYNIETWTWKVF